MSRPSRLIPWLTAQGLPIRAECRHIDLRTTTVALAALLLMNVFWYFGRVPYAEAHLAHLWRSEPLAPVLPFFYFCGASVLLRLIVPILIVRLCLRAPLSDFGFSTKGMSRSWPSYALVFGAVLPIVIYGASQPSFLHYYPRCRGLIYDGTIDLKQLLLFESVYGLLFLSGEAFWRGFLLFGLRPRFGNYAILVMLIPYVMSHYEKPFPETMGAILAGTVLGWLALRHGHFWWGVLVHWGVAMTMDILALVFSGVAIT